MPLFLSGWFTISLAGAALLLLPDGSQLAAWAVTVAALIALIDNALGRRSRDQRDQKRHEWEQADRDRIKDELIAQRALVASTNASVKADIAENTALTRAAVDQTNGITEKLLQTTAEAERAKGVLEGRDQAKAEEFGKP